MTIFYNRQRLKFAKTVAFALINILPILAWGQHDTLNKKDNSALKQGYWIEKAPSDCDSCEFLYQEGNYNNDKKEGVWKFSAIWGTETIEYHKGLKDGLHVRKEIVKQDTIIDKIFTYSNDTLIDIKYFSQLVLGGTATTTGKFLSAWYYLNPKRDTIIIRYYKPDSSQKTLGMGHITNFLYQDYQIYSKSNIPPLPSYCLQKSSFVSYFEKAGLFANHQNVKASKEIIEINTRENFEKISLYDSIGLLLSETISIGPAEVAYSKEGFDSSNVLYWYSDTNRIVLHQSCSKQYPSKISYTIYTNGQITNLQNFIDYGKDEKFVTISTFDAAGHKERIYIETPEKVNDSIFSPSGKTKFIYLAKKQPRMESLSVWYFENNVVRKTENFKDGKQTKNFYFDDGKINYSYVLDEKREKETRQLFNNKGKLICSFKRKRDKVKWVVYDEDNKKTIMQSKIEMIGEITKYIGCEFDETIK